MKAGAEKTRHKCSLTCMNMFTGLLRTCAVRASEGQTRKPTMGRGKGRGRGTGQRKGEGKGKGKTNKSFKSQTSSAAVEESRRNACCVFERTLNKSGGGPCPGSKYEQHPKRPPPEKKKGNATTTHGKYPRKLSTQSASASRIGTCARAKSSAGQSDIQRSSERGSRSLFTRSASTPSLLLPS